MTIREMLHDEVDIMEDLMDESKEVVERVILEKIEDALLDTGDVTNAMSQVAMSVEEELTDLTTKAFETGAGFARRRLRFKK